MSLKSCKHHHLVLLPETSKRLRCRHCHLTIKAQELNLKYCPECFENSGKRRADFEKIETGTNIRYRCEDCHAIIEYLAQAQ
jgi:hypothetical protein